MYYFHAYGKLVKDGRISVGDKINFSVPTGNFGDILAGWFAKQLGLPVNKLICASNRNNVLTDFFNEGTYDRNRPFYITTSPSMDILVSSNLERLLFYVSGEDAERTAALMRQLSSEGKYTIDADMRTRLADFAADCATEEETAAEIARVYAADNTAIDPHTAVASKAAESYKSQTGDDSPLVVVSTASPYKFPQAVLKALDAPGKDEDGLNAVKFLHDKTGVDLPATVQRLFDAPVLHDTVVAPDEMKKTVVEILK